ncbi:hypothetical protein Pla175_39310 [Pirellulimonas nuda]|uniref:Aminoglycoside phosphotransferase domain-containing protein n=1 Tax=Pirellulimonas nuda TaxID=2528009 RepID=A0A518DGC3_9BACT|nr:phosphotransferase [Pirellulimonas nuda]QDU90525.1 hypothetical protein Pla175_39310 [Pirellulimonas nuda]
MMEIGNAPERLERFFGPGHTATIEPLATGGLSGARVWRVRHRDGEFALRCSPRGRPGLEQTAWAHQCMAAAGLGFVPRPALTRTGPSCFEEAEGVWELQTWMPGSPALCAASPDAHLLATADAVTLLHRAWRAGFSKREPSPTLLVRNQRLARLIAEAPAAADLRSARAETPFAPELESLATQIAAAARVARAELDRVEPSVSTLHPVVIDLKQDHVLFTGDRVSGIVDFGAMAVDTPAVDWARLIGSIAGDDANLWRRWTDAAASGLLRAEAADLRALLPALDASGTVLSAANWLSWLAGGWRPPTGGEPLVRERLARLAGRLRALAQGHVAARIGAGQAPPAV